MRFLLDLYYRLSHLIREALKFGVVGGTAFVVDVGTFNVLTYAGGEGPLNHKPLTAKTIAVVLATTVAYLGNRHWTFRHRGRSGLRREYVLFFLLNGVGLAIALACLGFSRYVLDLRGVVPDNIAANVVGLGLGTLFRFWSYRRFVFPAVVAAPETEVTDLPGAHADPAPDAAPDGAPDPVPDAAPGAVPDTRRSRRSA